MCIFATFSCVTVPLLESLILFLNSPAERKEPSLPFCSLCEAGAFHSMPSASTARTEMLQVPAHTLPVSYIGHHIAKDQLKVSSMSFYLDTYLYFYSPILIPYGQEPLCGYEFCSLRCPFSCKFLKYRRGQGVCGGWGWGWGGVWYLEKKLVVYG